MTALAAGGTTAEALMMAEGLEKRQETNGEGPSLLVAAAVSYGFGVMV